MIWHKFPTVLGETDDEPCIVNLLEIAVVAPAGESYSTIHMNSGHDVQVAVPVSKIFEALATISES